MNLTPAVGVQAASSVRVTENFTGKASEEISSFPSPVQGNETGDAQVIVGLNFIQSSTAEVRLNRIVLRLRPGCDWRRLPKPHG